MQDDRVPSGILEEAHMADAGVVRLALEPDAFRLQLAPGLGNIGDANRKAADVRPELLAVTLGGPEGDRHVRRLDLSVGAALEPEHIGVEADGALDVARGNREEVDRLDLHGAYRRWSISWLPSLSLKKDMWHTPVSRISPSNSTPRPSSSLRASATSGTRSATCAVWGAKLAPIAAGFTRYSETFPVSISGHASSQFGLCIPSVSR